MKIAVDSEYSFDEKNRLVPICIAFVDENGTQTVYWRDALNEAKQYIINHKSDLFVAHNVESAEGRVWCALGLDPTEYRWHDTMLSMIAQFNTDSKSIRYDLLSCLRRARISSERDHDASSSTRGHDSWIPSCE